LAVEIALVYYTTKKTFEGRVSLTPEDENIP
jgi:type I restriction enzyme R subunit